MTDAITVFRYFGGPPDDVQKFINELPSSERARLNVKIHALRTNGVVLLGSNLLTDTNMPHIKEIVVNGRVAVRMLVCRGPFDGKTELTLLFGAAERDRKYVPKNALKIADDRRKLVASDPTRWRIKHE